MYSGTTFKALKWFDAWFGAHQKIDRTARRYLAVVCADKPCQFPTRRAIAKFEGINGPDGIKRKSPGDEPWHFIDPTDISDETVVKSIDYHYAELVTALRTNDEVRSAFEAAWLAHVIVDGLTPAHHYPYEKELVELRGGRSIDTRTTQEQWLIPGDTLRKLLKNNWKMWGDKGLAATHFAFEWGVAAIIVPLRLKRSLPTAKELQNMEHTSISQLFMDRVHVVADWHMYDEFYRSGWTPRLAKQVRRELAPLIINTVTLAWYAAIVDCQQSQKSVT